MMRDEPRRVSRGKLGHMGPAKTRLYPGAMGSYWEAFTVRPAVHFKMFIFLLKYSRYTTLY